VSLKTGPWICARFAGSSADFVSSGTPARPGPDQQHDREAGGRAELFREMSLNQGTEWKRLIMTYIAAMPESADASRDIEHMADGPQRMPVTIAMIAKTGVAAKHRKSAMRAAPPAPAPAPFCAIGF